MSQPRDFIGRFTRHLRTAPEVALGLRAPTPRDELVAEFESATRHQEQLLASIDRHRNRLQARIGGNATTIRPILTPEGFEVSIDYADGGCTRLVTFDAAQWQHEVLTPSPQANDGLSRIQPGDPDAVALLRESQRLARVTSRRWELDRQARQSGGDDGGLIA